jgi:hypothetical protein
MLDEYVQSPVGDDQGLAQGRLQQGAQDKGKDDQKKSSWFWMSIGPGVVPCIISAAMNRAITTLEEIPRVSRGTMSKPSRRGFRA